MIPRINLLQEAPPPPRELLSARTALVVWGMLLVLLAASGQYLRLGLETLAREVAGLTASQVSLEKRLTHQRERHPQVTPATPGRLAELEQRLQARQRVRDYVAGRGAGCRLGFSQPLRDLAGQRFPRLWLTQVELARCGQEVTLVGRALDQEAVFPFLEALKRMEGFRGREYPHFQMERIRLPASVPEEESPEEIRFALSTGLDPLRLAWERDLEAGEAHPAAREGSRP